MIKEVVIQSTIRKSLSEYDESDWLEVMSEGNKVVFLILSEVMKLPNGARIIEGLDERNMRGDHIAHALRNFYGIEIHDSKWKTIEIYERMKTFMEKVLELNQESIDFLNYLCLLENQNINRAIMGDATVLRKMNPDYLLFNYDDAIQLLEAHQVYRDFSLEDAINKLYSDKRVLKIGIMQDN